jgi:hypothetical protein
VNARLDELVTRQAALNGTRTRTDTFQGFDLAFSVEAIVNVIGKRSAAVHQHQTPCTGDQAGNFLRQVQHGQTRLHTIKQFCLRATRQLRDSG